MALLHVLLWGIGAGMAALALTPWIRKAALSVGCVSHPKEDRWGRRVIPRLGGLCIAAGLLAAAGWGSFQDQRLIGLCVAGALVSLIGIADDFKPLPPSTKLIGQIVASCVIVLSGIHVDLSVVLLEVPVTIGWLVLVMNAFNLLDNMDGLSAGIGAIAGVFYTWHALQVHQEVVAVISAALTGATFGFLWFNLPPAKIFMGDVGSQVLGLGLGSLALLESWRQSAGLAGMLAAPTLLLAIPIFDTLFVTIQRILNGRHPFQGGTDHTSHRLGLMGLTPRQVVFSFYTLAALLGGLSLFLSYQKFLTMAGVWLLVIGALLMLGACLARVRVYSGPTPANEETKATWIETMLMHKRRIVELLVDFMLIPACYVVAHALRFEGSLTPDVENLVLKSLPWIILIKMLCLFTFRVYRGVWRYISLSDLINIFQATLCGSALSALLVLYLWRFEGYSRAVFIIDGLLLFVLIGGSRVIEPLLNDWVSAVQKGIAPVVIVGAGDTGELLLQQLKFDRDGRRKVVGFLDDDPAKLGSRIHGVPILGTRRDLGLIVQKNQVREVYVAMRHPPQELLQQVRGYCQENGIAWKMAVNVVPQDRPMAHEG